MITLSRKSVCLLLITLALCFPFAQAQAQNIITTIAGGGRVFLENGGPATAAALGEIQGIARDSAGNIYATDRDNGLVVRISPAGILTVIGGNGITGFSGDGGSALDASLSLPTNIAVDSAGNVWFSDFQNQRIRKIRTDGIIVTAAGNGVKGFSGDGGPATAAALSQPRGLAFDQAGNLYIADFANHRIRKVTPGGIITTIAGSDSGGFSGDGGPATQALLGNPAGIALDAAGNLYITDTLNPRVRKIDTNGIITTVAGNGTNNNCPSGDPVPATSACLNAPYGIAVDAAGNIYVTGTFNHRIARISTDGMLTRIAGVGFPRFDGDGGPAANAALSQPYDLMTDTAGNLYVADAGNQRIRRIDGSGIITTVAGVGPQSFGDGGPAVAAALSRPNSVAVDSAGTTYIADTRNNRVRKVTANGMITTLAGNGLAAFSGDNGPAGNASLNVPFGVALDQQGNVYIADTLNGRIRKVAPNGIITTVAGGGSGGDGSPATAAGLCQPRSVGVDSAGNLYISDNCLWRVRKVSTAGIISTVAGNGTNGYSGDGGPAVNASFANVNGMAVDAAGTIYVADSGNARIRKITPGGTISTVAGSGNCCGTLGDGGPATAASINNPVGVGLDSAGNLYITQISGVRKVDSSGTITSLTRLQPQSFSGDGGAASAATLRLPVGVTVDVAGSVYIADTQNDRVRKILAATSFAAAPSRLDFTAPSGLPASAPQQLNVSSPISGLPWSVQAGTASGGNWLNVSPPNGSAPGIILATVDATSLTAGTYQGTITITAPLAAVPVQTVAVQLTVTDPVPPRLSVNAAALNFDAPPGNPPAQTLRIANAGSGAISWTLQASTQNGGAWLTATPASGSASAATPASVQVGVNPGTLLPGMYSGSLLISAPAVSQSQAVAVTLLVSPPDPILLMSQSGLFFTGVEGGGIVPLQTVSIVNTGSGTLNWSASTSTAAGGNWLSISPRTGSGVVGSLQVPLFDVGVNVTGLKAGQYHGLVRVESPDAKNAPQFVTVVVQVLPAGGRPAALAGPTGLIFTTHAGTTSPGSQTVRISTAGTAAAEGAAGVLTLSGGDWLEVQPRNFTFSATDRKTLVVQPLLGALAAGVYRGVVTLQFNDGSPTQAIDVLFVVASGTAVSTQGAGPAPADTSCAATRLLAVGRTLPANFTALPGLPSPVEVQVADDCGKAVVDATVIASFSNGDPPLVLLNLKNGVYSGTWRPVNATPLVNVRLRAERPPLAGADLQVQGQVSSSGTAPALSAGGVVNGATFAVGPVAPGSIISLFGRKLASASGSAAQLPLPTLLNGIAVTVGGKKLPLFFSNDNQINAQLPFDLPANTRQQVVVETGLDGAAPLAVTVPETINVSLASPGIFLVNQQGIGAVVHADTYQIVNESTPAKAGEYLAIFCTGLGAVTAPVASGSLPPAPAPDTLAMPEVTLANAPAKVSFSGLAPCCVGLYQVNFQVPANLPTGPQPLQLVINGVPSNSVVLNVK